MQTVLTAIYTFFGYLRALVGLFLPLFAEATDFARWPKWLKAVIGFALLCGACYGLYFVQHHTTFGRSRLQPDLKDVRYRWVADYYLPTVFLFIVAFVWLAYWLWKLLTADDDEAEFPDIKAAWDEAVAALARQRFPVDELPLFLVLGRTTDKLDDLFRAATTAKLVVAPGPPAAGAEPPPLRVYAWEEGVFVACPGASAWAAFCTKAIYGEADVMLAPADGGGGAAAVDPNKTIGPGGFIGYGDPALKRELQDLVRLSQRAELSPAQQARLRELADLVDNPAADAQARQKPPVVLTDDERTLQIRRIRYLCRLIAKSRSPVCPANGALALVPWAVTESADTARHGAGVLAAEVTAVRAEWKLRFPTFALVCDMETATGFSEFRRNFPDEMLKQRIGQKVPLAPIVKARGPADDPVAELVGGAARWIGLAVLPAMILQFLQLDGRGRPGVRATPVSGNQHNRNLYQLMRTVFERGPRLGELLATGIPPVGGDDDLGDAPLYGGCYIAATGTQEGDGQAFVQGVFQKVIEAQDKVQWTPEARAADARLGRLITLGYAGLAAAVLAGVAAVGVWAYKTGKT
jgi:hypothetical protein